MPGGGGKTGGKDGPGGTDAKEGVPEGTPAQKPGGGGAKPGEGGAGTPGDQGKAGEQGEGRKGPEGKGPEAGGGTGATDPALAEFLEENADPKSQDEYKKLLARAEGLRLDSMGYTFKSGGFGSAALSMVLPLEGLAEGWDRLTGDNVYSSEKGTVAAIQSGIERFRGILKIVSEISSAVSTISAIIAAGAALFSWAAGVGAAVAAVALKVSIVSGLIDTAAKGLDALLAIVQIVLNVYRAKQTDDPVERARLVQQMKKEAGEFSNSLTGTAMGLIAAPVGGAGKAASKGLQTGARVARRAVSPLAKAAGVGAIARTARRVGAFARSALRATRRSAKTSARESLEGLFKMGARTAKNLRRRVGNLLKPKATWRTMKAIGRKIRIGVKGRIPYSKVWKGRAHRTLQQRLDVVVVKGKSLGLETAQAFGEKQLLFKFGKQELLQASGGAKKGLEVGRDIEKAKAGTSPAEVDAGAGPGEGGAGDKALYWPSILEEIGTVRTDIGTAKKRMKKEYDKAAEDAGDKKQAVIALQGEPMQTGGRIRLAAAKQRADAEQGQANSEEAAEEVDKAKKGQEDGKKPLDQAEDAGKEAQSEGAKAEQKAKGVPEPEGWWEKAKQWVYEQTLGRIFRGLAKIQKGISDFVLEIALGAAGLDGDDMDLAGMKAGAEDDAKKDEETKADTEEAKGQGDEIDSRIATIKDGASNQEKAAVQSMVDTVAYIDALDAYDEALAEHEKVGQEYVGDAAAEFAARDERAEGDAETEESSDELVTDADVGPIRKHAGALSEAASGAPEQLRTFGNGAVDDLVAAIAREGAPSGPAATAGRAIVDGVVRAAAREHARIAKSAGALAEWADTVVDTGQLPALAQAAAYLDDLIAYFDSVVKTSVDRLESLLDQIPDAYGGGTGASGPAQEPGGEGPVPVGAPPPEE